jgi:hypothetical protein
VYGLDSTRSRKGPVTGSCEYENSASSFRKDGGIVIYLSDYYRFEKASAW